jgi:type IV pilus assembly protein PilA
MAEARNTVAAMGRAAVAAYDRERLSQAGTVVHRLCASASSVPRTVPINSRTTPSTEPGQGFQTGDEQHGWKCLRFEGTEPSYFQYTYQVGSGYKVAAQK